jgi:transposase
MVFEMAPYSPFRPSSAGRHRPLPSDRIVNFPKNAHCVNGYASGVFSSRKIARKLTEDVAFRVFSANNFPVHRTIREFRQLHLKEFSALFVQVVKLAREAA